MKKLYIYILIFLLLAITSSSQQITIYDYAKLVERNPRLYVIVEGGDATKAEIEIASELSSALDVRKVYKENEIGSLSNNLIIIGSPKTNKQIRYIHTDSLISIYGTNLIISGSTSQLKKAVNLLKDYETNKNTLSTNKLASKKFLSPKPNILSLMNILYIVLTITLIATMMVVMLKNIHKKIKKINSNYPQLINFAKKAIQKGSSKDEIKQILIRSGWPKNIIDSEFHKL